MTEFTYDCRNRLVKVKEEDGRVTLYEYDAENIRTVSVTNGIRTEYTTDRESTYSQTLVKNEYEKNVFGAYTEPGIINQAISWGRNNFNLGSTGSASSGYYYHVTTAERAQQIIESGELRSGRWEARVFAWRQQPTRRQASIAGLGNEAQTVIRFKTNASFSKDEGNLGKSIENLTVRTSDGQRLPISITDVEIVGFKKGW